MRFRDGRESESKVRARREIIGDQRCALAVTKRGFKRGQRLCQATLIGRDERIDDFGAKHLDLTKRAWPVRDDQNC